MEVQVEHQRGRGAGRGVEVEEGCGSTSRAAPFLAAVLTMAPQAAGFISGIRVTWRAGGPGPPVTTQWAVGRWRARAVATTPDPPPTSTHTAGAWRQLHALFPTLEHNKIQRLTSCRSASSSSSRASCIRKVSSAGSYTLVGHNYLEDQDTGTRDRAEPGTWS